MPKGSPSSPSSGASPGSPACGPTQPCPLQKSIAGQFTETELKCGEVGHVQATGVQISEGAATTFAIKRVRDGAALTSVNGPMNGQSVPSLEWRPKVPADVQATDEFEFDVSADGVSAKSSNKFKFKLFPDYPSETKTYNCTSGSFAWTGKFDISYANNTITVTVKIKLLNRAGAKPAAATDPLPALAADPVSDADKATMKADVEGKLSRKINLYRTACVLGASCTCLKPIVIVVNFVESGEHHEVNLFTGSGRANARNWTRVKTRDNSYAHETGHLLGWYDEYTGGATGSAPRWKANEPANVMNVGLTVPPEYGWDFRDWFDGKTGEGWTAK